MTTKPRWTSKPCPGCGSTLGRPADGVCGSCRSKLDWANARQNANPEQIDCNWIDPFLSDGSSISKPRPCKTAWENAFEFLARAVSDPLPSGAVVARAPLLIAAGQQTHYGYNWTRRFNRDVAKALAELWAATGPMLKECVETGHAKGSNLIANIARGELTVEQLNRAR